MSPFKGFYVTFLCHLFKETCHPDACALFLGGDNLADLQSKVIEDWIRVNDEIPQDFIHVIKKKKDDYGFIHFENEHYREVFFNKVKGLRINLDKEKKVVVKFQPVKRKFDHHSNKHDPVGRPCHDLFDNRTHFIIIVSLPSIVEENEIELHMEGEEIIISGKYKELNFDGDILKKLIPVGDFEYTFTLPSKINHNSKVKIEKIENSNIFKIEIKKEENKRIKLLFE
ncbi:unnamed protein product [Rhizophagus irregularis]|nr:unnamed protein product [Rhizophagus irregularis]